jgi:nucleotide-binding universal stress UspA family protein
VTKPSPPFTPPSIVVGVDGSLAAERAALWAVDEAVGRDLPLHLLAAYDGPASHGRAESALQSAAALVAADGRPVILTTDVVAGEPAAALQTASRTAAMICLGAVGLNHIDHPVGSTVSALAASALCPLAVVRGPGRHERGAPGGRSGGAPGSVVVELDETSDSAAVLAYAVEEARLRHAPLRVLGTWQSGGSDSASADERNRLVRNRLDRRLETWKHRYPDLDVEPVAVPGSGLAYLAAHGATIAVIVIGARNVIAMNELLGPAGLTALPDTSVLILERQRLL